MAPLSALLITDGRPGHFQLSEGVLAAVARLKPVTISRLEVRRPRLITPGMLWRLSKLLTPSQLLRTAHGIEPPSLGSPGLIVSAGGDTLAANIAAARISGAPNIFYGSLRRYDALQFSLVLTSYAERVRTPNTVMTLKPSARDPDAARPRHAPQDSTPVAGLLVGGDAGTFRYREQDWSNLLEFLKSDKVRSSRRWIVSNSPRTPNAISDRISRLAAEPESPITEFIDVRRAGTGTLDRLFTFSGSIICTGDSSSMLSEAVWMRRPVVAVFPAGSSLPPDEQGYRVYLEKSGWACSVPLADLTPARFEACLKDIRPLGRNPLDELSALISDRLPALA